MDTRLTELLPAALNFKNGDIKIIKNAGAVITHPFGSVMRSLLVAIYQLEIEEILIIGHYDCGMQGLEPSELIEKINLMYARNYKIRNDLVIIFKNINKLGNKKDKE